MSTNGSTAHMHSGIGKMGLSEQEFYCGVNKSLIKKFYLTFLEDFEIGSYKDSLDFYLGMGLPD